MTELPPDLEQGRRTHQRIPAPAVLVTGEGAVLLSTYVVAPMRTRLRAARPDPVLIALLDDIEALARDFLLRTRRAASRSQAKCDADAGHDTVSMRTVATMTTNEAARHLGVKADALRARARRGTIPAVRVDGEWRFSPADIVRVSR